MTIVSNTGPLIALAKADKLPLLKQLFGRIYIPLLEEIRQRGYWLSDELLDVAAKLAGEAE